MKKLIALFALLFSALAYAGDNDLIVSPRAVDVQVSSSSRTDAFGGVITSYAVRTYVHKKKILEKFMGKNPEQLVAKRNIVLVTAIDQGKKVSIDLRNGDITLVDQLDPPAP